MISAMYPAIANIKCTQYGMRTIGSNLSLINVNGAKGSGMITKIDSTFISTKNNDLEEKQTRLDLLGDLNQSGLHPLLSSKIKTQGE